MLLRLDIHYSNLYCNLDVIFTWVDEIRVGSCDFENDVSSASINSLAVSPSQDKGAA